MPPRNLTVWRFDAGELSRPRPEARFCESAVDTGSEVALILAADIGSKVALILAADIGTAIDLAPETRSGTAVDREHETRSGAAVDLPRDRLRHRPHHRNGRRRRPDSHRHRPDGHRRRGPRRLDRRRVAQNV